MKLNMNFILPDSCIVDFTDTGIRLTTTLAVKVSSVNNVMLTKYKPFISKRCGYIQLTKTIGFSDCNQGAMMKHYRGAIGELMVVARQVKIATATREIDVIRCRQLELNL